MAEKGKFTIDPILFLGQGVEKLSVGTVLVQLFEVVGVCGFSHNYPSVPRSAISMARGAQIYLGILWWLLHVPTIL